MSFNISELIFPKSLEFRSVHINNYVHTIKYAEIREIERNRNCAEKVMITLPRDVCTLCTYALFCVEFVCLPT